MFGYDSAKVLYGTVETGVTDRFSKKYVHVITNPEAVKTGAGVKIDAKTYKTLKRTHLWTPMPVTAYGAVVHSCLTDDDGTFWNDILVLLFPLSITVGLQLFMLYELFKNITATPTYMCSNNTPVVVCVFFVLLCNAKSNLDNVLVELSGIFYCNRYICESSMKSYHCSDLSIVKMCVSGLAVVVDFIVTIAVMIVGILYLNSKTSVAMIVISTVSVLFIDNIQLLICQAMLPNCYKEELADYHFELPNFPSAMKIIAKSILNKGVVAEENVEVKHRKILFFQLYLQVKVMFYCASSADCTLHYILSSKKSNIIRATHSSFIFHNAGHSLFPRSCNSSVWYQVLQMRKYCSKQCRLLGRY